MKIILSPAKKMKYDDSPVTDHITMPVYLKEAEEIKVWLQARLFSELKELWACNEKIAEQNVNRLSCMNHRVPDDFVCLQRKAGFKELARQST